MSMPSSRLEVATTAGSRPALRSSSTRARCSLDTEPWWARASSAGPPWPRPSLRHELGGVSAPPAGLAGGPFVGDLVEPVAQTLRQAAGVGEHDGRAVGLHQVGDALLDMRPDRGPLAPRPGRTSATGEPPSSPRSSTGTTTERSNSLPDGGWTISTLRLRGQIAGDLVHRADRRGQTDTAGRPGQQLVQPLQRQRRDARRAWCRPRRAPRRGSRSRRRSARRGPADVSIRNSDSGVVIRMSGGLVAIERRSAGGVSPERMPTRISGSGSPSRTDS